MALQITVFGFLWIILLAVCCLLSDIKYILSMVLLSMVLQSNNVFMLGTISVGVQAFTVAIALVRILFAPNKMFKMKRHYKGLAFSMTVFLIYICFNALVVKDIPNTEWINIIMLVVYGLFAVVLYNKKFSRNLNEIWFEKAIDTLTLFVLIIGFLQYLTIAGVSFLRPFLTTFIFNDVSNVNVIFHSRPSYLAFYSSFMEPSYCAAFLVGMFSLIAMRKKASKKNIFLMIAIGLAIILSRSSTAYGGLAIVILIMVLKFYNKRSIIRKILPIIVISGILIMVFNYDLLDAVLFSKKESASYSTRSTWNRWSWEAFLTSPVIGVGIGQSRASSLFFSLLAELGIIGFFIYSLTIVKILYWMFSKKTYAMVDGAAFAVIGVFICQLIACPDLNFSPFWMSLFLLVISINILTGGKNVQQSKSE